MKKTTFTLLLAVVCCYGTIRGQDLARWDLDNNDVASFQSTHTNAGKLTGGNGISDLDFTANGASAHAWEPFDEASAADFYEICLKPKPGYLLDISSLTFTEMRSADGIRSYVLEWSLDGFKSSHILADVDVPDDVSPRTATHPSLGIRVCDGQELCLRWYGHNTEDYNGEWYLSDVIVTGTESQACAPAGTPPSGLTLSNITGNSMEVSWTPGSSDATLVLAREGSPVNLLLCGGTPYAADPKFGQGTELGTGTFVVYNGPGSSFTMTVLKDGATYHLAALGYNYGGNCYQEDNWATASAATLCTKPSPVEKLMSSPADGQVTLAWAAPYCFDEVMVVASTQPISSMPDNALASDYPADPAFNPGTDATGDFTADEAIVYRGAGNKATVTNLNNDQEYYFRIFTFRAGAWEGGAAITEKPQMGCSFLGGDFIYLNELHFTNKNKEIDKGIEIAGKAGVNLENYLLAIYDNRANLERTIELSGAIDDEGQGYGAVWIPDPELLFASAIALVNKVTGVTTDFIAHRVSPGLVANDGPAEGQPAFWPGLNEDANTPVNYSVQRQGDIACPNTSQEWVGPVLASRGMLNFSQSAFPITLYAFEGELKGERVLLSWQTETEENNDFMAVEHSADARHFKEIGRVKGAGTTTERQSYALWHNTPQPGLNYYRLRQVDLDGAFEYHGPIAVEYKGEEPQLRVYPSLAAEQLVIEMPLPAEEEGELLIYDINGRPALRLATAPGFRRQSIDITALPPGQYFLQWRPEKGNLLTDRFVKL